MAQTGAQQTKNVCSHCGKTFDSREELQKHEANCQGTTLSGGAAEAHPATPKRKSREEIEADMRIEEGFEAMDN
jgi:hypothetical protein